MTRKILLALLCCSVGLSGCEHLSEKDKIEKVEQCEATRTQFDEGVEQTAIDIVTTTVRTHYSFTDKRCYVFVTEIQKLTVPVAETMPDDPVVGFENNSYVETLFDGPSKKELVKAVCYGFVSEESPMKCTATRQGKIFEDSGASMDNLTDPNGYHWSNGPLSFEHGRKVINERMSRP